MSMASVLLVILATSVGASSLTCLLLYVVYIRKVLPALEAKIQEIHKASESIESRVAAGVREGIKSAVRELPSATVKDTTRTVVKRGSELVEGGLASLFKPRDS